MISAQLDTGRTHQIRVHMQHIRFPLVGDRVYGQRSVRGPGMDERVRDALLRFPRQALHASRLMFEHPTSGEQLEFKQAWPEDFERIVELLRTTRSA